MQAFVGAAQTFVPLQVSSATAARPVTAPRSSFIAGTGPLLNTADRTGPKRGSASPLSMTAYRRWNGDRPGFRSGGYYHPGTTDLRRAMAASAPLIQGFFGDEFAREITGRDWPTMDRTSAQATEQTLIPEVRTGEDDEGFWLRLEVPGFPKEMVKVEIQGRTLVARGEMASPPAKETESATSDGDSNEGNAEAVESPKELTKSLDSRPSIYTSFETSFQLPKNASVDNVRAEMNDGVLFINIDKVQSEQEKIVPIEVS